MISDQEIANGVASVLRDPNNTVASLNGVVQQLEAKLGVNLAAKTGFIRDQIDLLLRPAPPPPKDHFTLQHHPNFQSQPQQQQQQQQQQLHHHQIPTSSAAYGLHPQHRHLFQTHLQPGPHEIDFRFPHQSSGHGVGVQPEPPVVVALPNAVPSSAAAASGGAKESASTGTKRRGGPGGLNKVCGVSPALQTIVGEPTMPRTQIVKQLWAYIRKNNLQDPSNKRKIICNDELKLVFETDCTDMFKMNKLLAKHIISLEPSKESGRDSKRLKAADLEAAPECREPGPSPVIISDVLANFFGTRVREMPQSEAVSRVWDYIKVNQLEDPLNSMVIHCDSKLQELFGCGSVSALGVSEMLVRHFFKRSHDSL